MKYYLPLLLLTSCAGTGIQSDFPSQPQVWGSLRGMMQQGITDAGITLQDAMSGSHMWGLGAVQDLNGEITVMDSIVFLAHPISGQEAAVYQSSPSADTRVALLVLAEVEAWNSYPIDRDINSQAHLEAWVAAKAEQIGWSAQRVLPFRVIGKTSHLQLHVIDGERLEDAGNSHQDHLATAIERVWKNTETELFGFRSLHHKTVFTHHDTTIHVHGVTADNSSGHLDEVSFKAGACQLLLPQ